MLPVKDFSGPNAAADLLAHYARLRAKTFPAAPRPAASIAPAPVPPHPRLQPEAASPAAQLAAAAASIAGPVLGPARAAAWLDGLKAPVRAIIETTVWVASIDLDRFRAGNDETAAKARQLALAVLVLSKTETPAVAADAVGVVLAALRGARTAFEPIVAERLLPIVADPVGCVPVLWRASASVVPPIDQCIAAASRATGVPVMDIRSARRTAEIVKARQIACWLAKTFTPRSLPEIGRKLGGRDHTTVLHACRRAGAVARTVPGEPQWFLDEWAAALWQADWKAVPALSRRRDR